MWNSKTKGYPLVEYGYEPKSLIHKSKGSAVDSVACKTYKTVNNEVIINVDVDKMIFYRVSNHKNGPWSEIHSFESKSTGDFTFLAFGDSNFRTEDGKRMPKFLKKLNSDLVIHLGDVAYDGGRDMEEWDNYGKLIEPLASSRPVQYVVGNHDSHCDDKYEQFQFRFSKAPGKLSRGGNIFYSFDFSYVHFIILSSEPIQNFREGSTQYNWLKKDLQNVDRKKTPWIIVSHHQPAYNPNNTGDEELRKHLDPLYEKYKVDIVLVGHVHMFGRSCAALHGKCNKLGPIHLSLGTGGADSKTFRDKPAWTEFREYTKGVGIFQVSKKKIEFKFTTVDDKIIDKYTFTK